MSQPKPWMSAFGVRPQPVGETHALNISAGVSNSSVLRRLSFSCLATLFKSACEHTDKSVPLGKHCLKRPLIFSLEPRGGGTLACGRICQCIN